MLHWPHGKGIIVPSVRDVMLDGVYMRNFFYKQAICREEAMHIKHF